MKPALIALAAILSSPIATLADDDVLTVDAQPEGLDYLWMITVTSRADALDVANLEVNRGNCKAQAVGPALPRILRFGESVRYRTAFCHPIEVVVDVGGMGLPFSLGPEVAPGQVFRVSAEVYADAGYRNLLTVTNYSDDVTLSQVTINRGNCGPFGDRKVDPPKQMHFGDYFEIRSFPCRPVEVTAQTDKGPITMKLD